MLPSQTGYYPLEIRPGLYTVQAVKTGFGPVRQADLNVQASSAISLELTMIAIPAQHDTAEVSANAPNIEQGASVPNNLNAQSTKDTLCRWSLV